MKRQLFLNEICDSQDRERDHLMHLKRLYTIKPTFKIKSPKKPKFLLNNISRELKRAQTQYNIENENMILRDRLSYIYSKKGPYNQKYLRPKSGLPAFKKTYINYSFQDIENMKKTLQENIKIYNKVNNMRSYYEFKNINKEAKLQVKYMNNLLKENRHIKKPPSLDYINFEQFKQLIEAQNENENENEEINNDNSNGVIEEDTKEDENEKNDEKNEENGINEENKDTGNNNDNKGNKKYNVSTTNNSTKDKNLVH